MAEAQRDPGPARPALIIQRAWRQWRKTVPFGQAAVLALLVNMLGGAVLVLLSPSHEAYRAYVVVDGPDPDARLEQVLQEAGPSFERCVVGPVPDDSVYPDADRADRVIDCEMGPLMPLEDLGRVARAAGVGVLGGETSLGLPSADRIPPGLQVLAALFPVAVALFLLRGVPWRDDLRRGGQFLRRRPYVLLLSPLVVPLVFVPLAMILPAGPPEAAEATQFLVLSYGFFADVLVGAPLFEEAVFRQWAYRSDDRPPAGLGRGPGHVLGLHAGAHPQPAGGPDAGLPADRVRAGPGLLLGPASLRDRSGWRFSATPSTTA
jgi:hypothetical protein